MSHGISAARLRKIEKRQVPYRFGAEYVPSIFASRDEAPSISSPAFIKVRRWRRTIHSLSSMETIAILLALLHPSLVDLHEQSMIPRWPAPHPAEGMPGLDGARLPIFQGTVQVSERLGCLDVLPVVYEHGKSGRRIPIVYPYVGDVLLFLHDELGIYCVNWNVKASRGDHTKPGPEVRLPYTGKDLRYASARYDIELHTYADVDIRTVPVAGEEIDPVLAANLRRVYPYCTQNQCISDELRRRILTAYRQGLSQGEPPREVLVYLVNRGVCDDYAARHTFYTGLFEGELRINLMRPLLFDCPVELESANKPFPHAEWFQR